jgi:hypothetical protein
LTLDEGFEIGGGEHAAGTLLPLPYPHIPQRARGDVGVEGFDRATQFRGGLAGGEKIRGRKRRFGCGLRLAGCLPFFERRQRRALRLNTRRFEATGGRAFQAPLLQGHDEADLPGLLTAAIALLDTLFGAQIGQILRKF